MQRSGLSSRLGSDAVGYFTSIKYCSNECDSESMEVVMDIDGFSKNHPGRESL
jgi:hypothetical protein